MTTDPITRAIAELDAAITEAQAKLHKLNSARDALSAILAAGDSEASSTPPAEEEPELAPLTKPRKPNASFPPGMGLDDLIVDILGEADRPLANKEVAARAMVRAERLGVTIASGSIRSRLSYMVREKSPRVAAHEPDRSTPSPVSGRRSRGYYLTHAGRQDYRERNPKTTIRPGVEFTKKQQDALETATAGDYR